MQKFQLLVDDKLESIGYIEFMQTLIAMPVTICLHAYWHTALKAIAPEAKNAQSTYSF